MLVLLLLAACNLEVFADAFDQSCAIDDDCVLVDEGNVCGQCTTLGALNVDDEDDFYEEVSERTRACTIISLEDCPGQDGVVATCDDGTCRAVIPE